MEKDPFNHISYRIEIEWCRTETKGEKEVNVELTSQFHAKYEVVIWVNWNILISGFHVKFCYQGTWAIMGNPANNLINLKILERKILRINAVVHSSTPWGRQINYQAPLARLTLLRNDPKTSYMQTRKKGEEKGPSTLPRETSLARYASTMWAWWRAEG